MAEKNLNAFMAISKILAMHDAFFFGKVPFDRV